MTREAILIVGPKGFVTLPADFWRLLQIECANAFSNYRLDGRVLHLVPAPYYTPCTGTVKILYETQSGLDVMLGLI